MPDQADDGISKQSVRDLLSDKIAYMICSGLLQVGDRLPSERALAKTFDISRETVRGAIQRLADLGMVEVSHGRPTIVIRADGFMVHDVVKSLRELKAFDIEHVYAARRTIESIIVREAALAMTNADLARMGDLLADQATLFNDPVQFQISDQEFHELIYRRCSNQVFVKIVRDLYAYGLDYRRKVMSQLGQIERSYRDHLAIYAALQQRDPDASEAAIGGHLNRIHETTRRQMVQG
jgi:DNA-binding FadR family transcriptional regulator